MIGHHNIETKRKCDRETQSKHSDIFNTFIKVTNRNTPVSKNVDLALQHNTTCKYNIDLS